MALINLYLDVDSNYKEFLNDSYKIIVILLVIQMMVYFSNDNKNLVTNALTGDLWNDNLFLLIIYILVGVSSYYFVFEKVFKIM